MNKKHIKVEVVEIWECETNTLKEKNVRILVFKKMVSRKANGENLYGGSTLKDSKLVTQIDPSKGAIISHDLL